MAFFTARAVRDPLKGETGRVWSHWTGRGIGAALLVLSLPLVAMLWTWSPEDPSLFNSVDRVPVNALGYAGATLSEVFLRAIGWAAWGLPLALAVWGLRLATKRDGGRAVTRILFVPPALVLAAAFAAVHVPPASWLPDFGIGGLLGDQVAAALLVLIPLEIALALPLLGVALGLGLLIVGAFALGVDRAEAHWGWRALRSGWARSWHVVAAALAWLWVRKTHLRPRPRQVEEEPAPAARLRREPGFDAAETEEPSGRERLMARINAAVARREEPEEVVEPAPALEAAARDEPVFRPVVQHKAPKPQVKSRAAQAEEQPQLDFESDPARAYDRPALSLLENPIGIVRQNLSDEALEQNARMLESVLDDYGIRGEIVSVRPGPVVTMYELEPAPGLKASRVIGLADDIARSMSALAARVSTVPGRSIIGIELPNEVREKVLLREILSAPSYGDSKHKLPLALGKDIGGEPVVANLARMPHLLIAGTTGSGKSVAINTMILSLLYHLGPEECRLIMIDPKMLELSVYDGIPHLLSPVVTDPKKAVVALKWTVAEMEERYRKMSKMGVRNIDGYNARVEAALEAGEAFTRTVQTGFDDETGEPIFETEEFAPEKMPFIVVIVDEMADLMMVAGKEIEACIQRLAQMARASGIHLIMATQRPSVDVITGTIKANFPTRISFQVTSKIDSRTILGEMGAEQLLGMGDMLYMAGGGRITRVHGPFVSDEEVEDVVNHLKTLGAPEYISGVQDGPDEEAESDIDLVLGLGGNTGSEDALYDQAVAIVARDRKCSTSYIQRKLAIGYNKAARLVEQMEENGVVTPANKVGKREILVPEA